MIVDFSIDGILGRFAYHIDRKGFERKFQVDTLAPLMITFLIPIYLCILRPFIQNYIPGSAAINFQFCHACAQIQKWVATS